MIKTFNPEEIKKCLFEDILNYHDSEFHVKYSTNAIKSIISSFESVNYNLYDFFDKRAYVLISSSRARRDVLEAFLEKSHLRDIMSNYYYDMLAFCPAFENETMGDMVIVPYKQGQPQSWSYEESIRSLFLMESEGDLWNWFSEGHGSMFVLYNDIYSLANDNHKKAIEFLTYVIRQDKEATKKHAIRLLENYYEREDEDKWFIQSGQKFVKTEDGIRIFTEDSVIDCDDFRVSGWDEEERYPDPDEGPQQNIIYAWQGDSIRMFAKTKDTLCLLMENFDHVYYIGSSVNVVEKDDKQTYIHDRFGVLFPLKEGNSLLKGDILWFDECAPVNDEKKDDTSDSFLVFKVLVDGETKTVSPTNTQFLNWVEKF